MISYKIDFTDGAKVTLKNGIKDKYDIIFTDNDTNQIIYKTSILPNSWAKTNQIYYKNWNIKIINHGKIITDYNINLKGKKVLIKFQSSSLGDSLAWIPYVEEFRKKHNCKLYCSTFMNSLFEKEYDKIKFINPNTIPHDTFAIYHLGWFLPFDNKNPQDYKKIPLQQTASDILGLEFKEIKPKITNPYSDKKKSGKKYVCLAEFSTANAKHWHYPTINNNKGWQELVNWLNYNNYDVMVISKQKTHLKNIIDRTGDYPLEFRMFEIQNSEFFIGIGSGLSWLAWTLNKKVIMISGFSDPLCEFKSDNIRIINKNVCNSCFNKYEFDRGDWNWCPEHKNTDRQFECTTQITPNMVINKIIENKLIDNPKQIIKNNIKLNSNDIDIEYIKNEKKIIIKYKNRIPIDNVHINIKDGNDNILKTFKNSRLDNNHIIWASFNKINTNKFIIDFFNEQLLLNYTINLAK